MSESRPRLENQPQLLSSMLEQLGDGVVAADATGKLTLFNPAAERILGLGRTNKGPDQWAEHYQVFRPDGVTPCPTEDLPLVRTMRGESFDGYELAVRLPLSPGPAWLTFSGRPLEGGGGIVVFHDVTERKLSELQIRSLNTVLEERVRQRTEELVQANRDLEHKNQDLEMFIYSVSHDLRSPLVNLQGFSKELEATSRDVREIVTRAELPTTVRERGARLVDDDMAMSIRFIQTAVTRLGGIIDALLRLSRAGRVEYQRQAIDMTALVERVIDSLQATIAQRGAWVEAQDLPPAWGDPVALEQVFANLIGNALNYLDPERPGRIEIGVAGDSADGSRTYFVRDNGLGIPEGHLPKLFQVFQRLHPAAAKGEGVGLVLVRRIVERHGGRIRVESRAGVGSTFYVTLPTGPREDASPARTEAKQHVA